MGSGFGFLSFLSLFKYLINILIENGSSHLSRQHFNGGIDKQLTEGIKL